MKIETLVIGLLIFLYGCNDKKAQSKTEILEADGTKITTQTTEGENSLDKDYKLTDLSPELEKHIQDKILDAEGLILKYNGKLPDNKYDSKVLDEVFDKWRKSSGNSKEKPEFIIEALGAAFGQDIVNELDCEWKLLTDQYGSDISVIHKKFTVNGFPFSSAQKAYTENRSGSFNEIKLVLKKHIQEAEVKEEINQRK